MDSFSFHITYGIFLSIKMLIQLWYILLNIFLNLWSIKVKLVNKNLDNSFSSSGKLNKISENAILRVLMH